MRADCEMMNVHTEKLATDFGAFLGCVTDPSLTTVDEGGTDSSTEPSAKTEERGCLLLESAAVVPSVLLGGGAEEVIGVAMTGVTLVLSSPSDGRPEPSMIRSGTA